MSPAGVAVPAPGRDKLGQCLSHSQRLEPSDREWYKEADYWEDLMWLQGPEQTEAGAPGCDDFFFNALP